MLMDAGEGEASGWSVQDMREDELGGSLTSGPWDQKLNQDAQEVAPITSNPRLVPS